MIHNISITKGDFMGGGKRNIVYADKYYEVMDKNTKGMHVAYAARKQMMGFVLHLLKTYNYDTECIAFKIDMCKKAIEDESVYSTLNLILKERAETKQKLANGLLQSTVQM